MMKYNLQKRITTHREMRGENNEVEEAKIQMVIILPFFIAVSNTFFLLASLLRV